MVLERLDASQAFGAAASQGDIDDQQINIGFSSHIPIPGLPSHTICGAIPPYPTEKVLGGPVPNIPNHNNGQANHLMHLWG